MGSGAGHSASNARRADPGPPPGAACSSPLAQLWPEGERSRTVTQGFKHGSWALSVPVEPREGAACQQRNPAPYVPVHTRAATADGGLPRSTAQTRRQHQRNSTNSTNSVSSPRPKGTLLRKRGGKTVGPVAEAQEVTPDPRSPPLTSDALTGLIPPADGARPRGQPGPRPPAHGDGHTPRPPLGMAAVGTPPFTRALTSVTPTRFPQDFTTCFVTTKLKSWWAAGYRASAGPREQSGGKDTQNAQPPRCILSGTLPGTAHLRSIPWPFLRPAGLPECPRSIFRVCVPSRTRRPPPPRQGAAASIAHRPCGTQTPATSAGSACPGSKLLLTPSTPPSRTARRSLLCPRAARRSPRASRKPALQGPGRCQRRQTPLAGDRDGPTQQLLPAAPPQPRPEMSRAACGRS